MTEQEYTNVRDLSRIVVADRQLREIMPEFQKVVDPEEIEKVLRIFIKWRQALLEQIVTK